MSASTAILAKGYEKPALNKKVYSKYRELLGNYNGKANEIIQSLPSYMVHEDKGFNFEGPTSSADTVDRPKALS